MMKERVLKGWNLRRLLFAALGGTTAIMAFIDNDWLVGSFGLFVAIIGVFSLGCVSGRSCGISSIDAEQPSKGDSDNVEYEEVK